MSNTEKILYLDAIDEIKKLKYRYFKACDTHNTSAIASCFSEKLVLIDFENFGVFNSAESMLKVYKEKSVKDGQTECHYGKNPVIEIKAEKASGQWGLAYSMIDFKKSIRVNIQGFYLDNYIRQDNTWKISSSTFRRLGTLIQKLV